LNIDKHLEEEISFRSRAFSNYENNNIRETAYPININIKGPINSENISFEVSTARDQVHESTQTVESGNISSSRNC
jgi:ribosomal protein S3